jgi:tetratricopeptide (TPR) repeat protein
VDTIRFSIVLLLGLSALAHGAPADSETAEARAHYERGLTHYNLQEYRSAIAEFKEAYRLHPSPTLLYNIAQCQRLVLDAEAALASYRAYLRSLPEAPNRVEVQGRIAGLEKLIAEKQRPVEPVIVKPETKTEPPPPPPPAPPTEKSEPAPTTTLPALTATAPPARKPLVKRWWLWTAVGVVAAGAAVGVGLGVGLAQSHNTYPKVSF